MEVFGTVAAILDDTKLLIRLEKFTVAGTELTVFAAIERPEFEQVGLEKLLIPKGLIRVTVQQNENIYLATRYQEASKGTALNALEYALSARNNWSATFDKSQSLGVEYAREIKIGDPVGNR